MEIINYYYYCDIFTRDNYFLNDLYIAFANISRSTNDHEIQITESRHISIVSLVNN